jgi:hypothetical protein
VKNFVIPRERSGLSEQPQVKLLAREVSRPQGGLKESAFRIPRTDSKADSSLKLGMTV